MCYWTCIDYGKFAAIGEERKRPSCKSSRGREKQKSRTDVLILHLMNSPPPPQPNQMDDLKQLGPNEFTSSSKFPYLNSILQTHGKSIVDILQYHDDHSQLSRLVDRPIREIDDYYKSIEADLTPIPVEISLIQEYIPTGLPSVDLELGGGIPFGEVVEVFGASGCGKSHLLFQLLLQCQLKYPKSKSIHICTESFLETKRLNDIFEGHNDVSMDNISYVYCQDFESQDHIIFSQLPAKLEQEMGTTRLVIIDSIAQHFRREDCLLNANYLRQRIEEQEMQLGDVPEFQKVKIDQFNQLKSVRKDVKYTKRSTRLHYLCLLHRHLTRLAKQYNVAIVVVNQVSDHTFDPMQMISDVQDSDLANPLNLDIQTGISSGWDAVTLYDYIPVHLVNLNQGQLELLDYELAKSFNSNKRQKLNDDDDLRTPIVDRAQELEDAKELILKSYRLRNRMTKKVVPTLGYPWTKRINTRFMLSKSYKPIMRSKEELQLETLDEPCNSIVGGENTNKRPLLSATAYDTPESLIKGWHVERFIKVVASSCTYNANRFNRYRFKIDKSGLIEV